MIGAIDEAKKRSASRSRADNRSAEAACRSRSCILRFSCRSRSSPRRPTCRASWRRRATGSFGLLPHRLDCVAALAPGILTYETEAERRGLRGGGRRRAGQDRRGRPRLRAPRASAARTSVELREAVEREFLTLDEQEKSVRSVMAKLEAGFLRRFASFQHE